jgi:hypothetical protein
MKDQTKQANAASSLLAAAVAAALAFPIAANAERGEAVYYEPPEFTEMDIDDSGKLEPAEVQGRSPLAGQWDRFDTDGDGLIDPAEFKDFQAYEGPTPEVVPPIPPEAEPGPAAPPLGPEIGAPDFDELDIDGDGVLSKGEGGGRKGLLDEWWQVDKDRNNVIDRNEFSVFEAKGPSLPPKGASGQ